MLRKPPPYIILGGCKCEFCSFCFLQMQTVFCEENKPYGLQNSLKCLKCVQILSFRVYLLWTISTLLKNLSSSLGGTTESEWHET